MKKITLLILAIGTAVTGIAQMQTPAPSPSSSMTQMVGLTEVKVDYSRPSMRGRTVFGNLVPFGNLWRTGANANSTISFSDDVTIGGQTLKAGKYAIFKNKQASQWEVLCYWVSNHWGNHPQGDVRGVGG